MTRLLVQAYASTVKDEMKREAVDDISQKWKELRYRCESDEERIGSKPTSHLGGLSVVAARD
jgi:uncharacterized protein